MDSFLLDTNIIIDANSARILKHLNYMSFYVSQVVFKEEMNKQIPNLCNYNLNTINESYDELSLAYKYHTTNKKISYYDALNLAIAKVRKMVLVTGDQQLVKFCKQQEVNCIGTIKLIEILLEKQIICADESIIALEKLKSDSSRRIPHELIDMIIEKIKSTLILTK